MYTQFTKENFKKISSMAVIVTTMASLSLISTVPVFGQSRLEGSAEVEEVTSAKDESGKSSGSESAFFKDSKERPPDCLEANPIVREEKDYVQLKNKCQRSMRFKIVYDNAPDSECTTIGTAYTTDYKYPSSRFVPRRLIRFTRLESC